MRLAPLPLLACLALASGCTLPVSAQEPSPSRWAFVVMHGADTVAVERVLRTSGGTRGDLVVNRALRVSYVLDVNADQAVSEMVMQVGGPDGPMAPDTLRLRADSSAAVASSAQWAEVPYPFTHVPGLLDHVLLRARALGGATVSVPVFRQGQRTAFRVRFVRPDSATVDAGGHPIRVALDADGSLLRAVFPDHGVEVLRTEALPAAAYPPAPLYDAPPGAPYAAEEVRFPNSEGDTLAGTLTLPFGYPGPRPAFVTITGTSQVSRNGGGLPGVPFRTLADALSRRGLAVLRVDDRGVGRSGGDASRATLSDEADDVRSALAYLRSRADIDGSRLALLGWSEGGWIAPMIAAEDSLIAGVVLMGAPGGTGLEVGLYQNRYAVEHDPTVPEALRDSVVAAGLIEARSSPKQRSNLDMPDPLPTARRVRAPVLILHGAADRNVPPQHAGRLAKAFQEGGNLDVTVRVFPGLNHVWLPDPDGRSSGWALLPSFSIPRDVLDVVADWSASHLADPGE